MPSTYQRLADYLAAQPGDRVTLTFAEIEAILGAPLPAGAYAGRFWANRRRAVPTRLWRAAGWRVAGREAHRLVRERRMTFARRPPDSRP